MKKILLCICLVLWGFLFTSLFLLDSKLDFAEKAGTGQAAVTLERGEMGIEQFLKILTEKSKEYDVTVTAFVLPSSSYRPNEYYHATLYTTNVDWYINHHSAQASEASVSIPLFHKSFSLCVAPLDETMPSSFNRDYQLLSSSENDIRQLLDSLQQSEIQCTNLRRFNLLPGPMADSGVKLAIFFVLLLMVSAMNVAVLHSSRMHRPVSPCAKIGIAEIAQEFCRCLLRPCGISLLCTALPGLVILYCYNRWIRFAHFALLCLACVFVALLLACILTVFLWLAVQLYEKQARKATKKWPVCAVPIALAVTVGILFLTLLSTPYSLYQQYRTLQTSALHPLKNYATFGLQTIPSTANDYTMGIKCKKLFALESKRGAILIRPDGLLSLPQSQYSAEEWDLRTNPTNRYFWRNNGVMINNNYLAVNPIYDTAGVRIDLNAQEFSDCLTVLVPEKFERYEAALLQDFIETFTWSSHVDEDVYRESLGEIPPEHPNKKVNIVYVKDDSNYFSFSPTPSSNDAYYTDVIGIVVNSVNYGGDTYYSAVSKGEFKAKLVNQEASRDYFLESLKAANLLENVHSVYRADTQLRQMSDYICYLLFYHAVLILLAFLGVVFLWIGLARYLRMMVTLLSPFEIKQAHPAATRKKMRDTHKF